MRFRVISKDSQPARVLREEVFDFVSLTGSKIFLGEVDEFTCLADIDAWGEQDLRDLCNKYGFECTLAEEELS